MSWRTRRTIVHYFVVMKTWGERRSEEGEEGSTRDAAGWVAHRWHGVGVHSTSSRGTASTGVPESMTRRVLAAFQTHSRHR